MSEGHPHHQGTHIAFSFPATPDSISDVRHLVMAEAGILPFTSDDLDDIGLAVTEAFTNIVQHAHGYRIRGVCEIRPDRFIISFEVEKASPGTWNGGSFRRGCRMGGGGFPCSTC